MTHNELYHHGIKGMRWGVRRTPEQLGHKKPESSTWKKKDAKYLSDAELQRRINRLQKERQYSDMTASTASKIGKAVVGSILTAAAVEVSKEIVKGHFKDIGKLVDKKTVSTMKKGFDLTKNILDNNLNKVLDMAIPNTEFGSLHYKG